MNYNKKKQVLITFVTPIHILDSTVKKNIKKNTDNIISGMLI